MFHPAPPRRPGGWSFYFGPVPYAKGDYDRAITDFTEAIRIKPDHVHAWQNRGWAYWLKGDLDKALADMNQKVKLDPEVTNGYTKRGDLMGTFVLELDTHRIVTGEALAQLLGLTSEDVRNGTLECLLPRIHPDDRDRHRHPARPRHSRKRCVAD